MKHKYCDECGKDCLSGWYFYFFVFKIPMVQWFKGANYIYGSFLCVSCEKKKDEAR